jgi:hypothetical protein
MSLRAKRGNLLATVVELALYVASTEQGYEVESDLADTEERRV